MSEVMKDSPMQRAEYLQDRLAEDIAEMRRLLESDANPDTTPEELARVHAQMDALQLRHTFALEKWKELVQQAPRRAKPDLHVVPNDEQDAHQEVA